MTELQKSPQVDQKGFLLRYETVKGRSGWKRRWAVLCDFCLYLYKDPNSKECFFALLLPGSVVTQSHDSSGQYRSSIKVEEPNQQPVYLSTETPLDFELWFDALSAACQMQKVGSSGGSHSLQLQQQFAGVGGVSSSSGQYGHTETTVTTITTQQQQQQQQQQKHRDGFSVGIDGGQQQRHQFGIGANVDYRDDSGGDLIVRGSIPNMASADGQYSVRQQTTTTSSSSAARNSNAAAATVERSQSEMMVHGSPRAGLRARPSLVAEANGLGGGGRMEITTVEERTTYGGGRGGYETATVTSQQQQQHQQRTSSSSVSGIGLVRAEPILTASYQQQQQQQQQSMAAATRPTALSGRYDVRTSTSTTTEQQSGRMSGGGGGGSGGGSYGVAGISGAPLGASNFSVNRRAIETVREDPQMDDSDIIATAPLEEIKRKYPVSGLAKRMSIAASDLLGKSHDELLLLLIQLNREKASLERRRDYYLALLRRQPDMRQADRMQADLREIENQIELHDPLVTFIDNIISMGSLYNGDDVMFASEYRQHLLQPGELKPVKANVGFLRRQQEREVARQFSDHVPGLDSIDASIVGLSGGADGGSDSHEFTKTRQQLEAELHDLETAYADHRRRKTTLATFMSDLGRRQAVGNAGGGSRSSRQQNQQQSGSYLETDLDTGATIDLAAKFPLRRTNVAAGSASARQQKQQSQEKFDASANGAAGSVKLRSGVGVSLDRRALSNVSDDVFHFQQQQQKKQQQQQQQAARHTVVGDGGLSGGGRYEVTETTTTTTSRNVDQSRAADIEASYRPQQQQQQYGYSVEATVDSKHSSAAAPNASSSSSTRIPDPDEFLRQRVAAKTASSASPSGLPPGEPAPEVYVSQPQLHLAYSGDKQQKLQHQREREQSSGSGGGHTMSMQEKLNLALGYDSTDNVRLAQQQQQRKQSAAATLGAGTNRPLISLDASRYKRNTNFAGHHDHRGDALENLGHFVEDMRGLQRGTYQRVEE